MNLYISVIIKSSWHWVDPPENMNFDRLGMLISNDTIWVGEFQLMTETSTNSETFVKVRHIVPF